MTSLELVKEQRRTGGVPRSVPTSHPDDDRIGFPAMAHFGDPEGEYEAVGSDTVLFDISDRSQIELTGTDARQFLNSFCTNDLLRMGDGEGCEAFVANIKGRILAHIFVFLNERSIWIETSRHAEKPLLAHLDRYLINRDVQFHSQTDRFGELFVTGPRSAERLSLLDIHSDDIAPLEHKIARRDQGDIVFRRVDLFEQPGIVLSIDRERIPDLWRELTASGIRPGGADAFHAHRIACGFPIHGIDLTDAELAQESSREQKAISFTKGCYLGQAPIARLNTRGHVNRKLRVFKFDSTSPPRTGAPIRTESGREIGVISSSAIVPGENRSVALGIVRSSHAHPESTVVVLINDREVPATVFWHEQPTLT